MSFCVLVRGALENHCVQNPPGGWSLLAAHGLIRMKMVKTVRPWLTLVSLYLHQLLTNNMPVCVRFIAMVYS